MKEILGISIVLLFLLFGCKEKTSRILEDKIYVVDVNVSDDMKNIGDTGTEYFIDCQFIQLDTDTNNVIGEVSKIIVTDGRIYILDTFKAQSVFIFDTTGKYINKIYRQGKGPGEYLQVTDIFYDEREKTINLLDSRGKILIFNKDGNVYKKEINFRFYAFNFQKDINGNYIFNSKNNPFSSFNDKITVFSSTQKKMYSAFPISEEWKYKSSGIENELIKSGEQIFYIPQLETDVYKITSDSVQLKYHYNFGKYNFPDQYKNPKYIFPPHPISLVNYILELKLFCETKKYLLAKFLFHGQYRINIYDKQKRKSYSYNLIDNPLIEPISFGDIIAMNDDFIITMHSANDVFNMIHNEELQVKYKDGIQKIKNQLSRPLNEDDNPILCIYRLKK
ncbi:6-bladed beta-propeller [Parabacteroides pacaensis]|uniref:6-bladed beta-propeller n=1 Tax=Parabacteroides pacaensis TaxID=2086575 RepID=UPI000D10E87E|nr:6-bladed beta-propeller [Parabacteroides pacaensis]